MIAMLNEQLNIDISYSQPVNYQYDVLNIKNDYLRNSILADMEGKVGSHVLKLSLPIEEYARYKNNNVSSMIKKMGSLKNMSVTKI
jgi:hypothetical protein